MGGYSLFHWLIVALLLGYLWVLVKIARPKRSTAPVKMSKAWLTLQTALSWLCSIIFGLLALAMLAGQATRKPENVGGGPGYLVGLLIVVFGVPMLFALSVRWTRISMRKWNAIGASAVETAVSTDQKKP